MAKRKTQAQKIAEMPIENVMRLGGEAGRKQLIKYVRTLRSGYTRRVQSFKRKGIVSHAQIALEGSMPIGRKSVQLTKLTRNQLLLEFARYAKFFQDVTSSEEGIKKVNKEQDIRIFGADSRGRPKKTMSPAEREKFWSLYEEFQNQNPTSNSRYGSESVQQMLADALFDNSSNDNIIELLSRVEKNLSEKSTAENLKGVPNVYAGRWTGFTE